MITATDIVKRFGSLEVLRGVNLTIAPHAVTAIVGASGAGKTTLLHILGTLERPDAGTVTISGTDVTTMSDRALSASCSSSTVCCRNSPPPKMSPCRR